ncbi:chromate efflux transporter [Notoacmeibacter sp. MSK16QG-6]|uniref:chromate efflux transporter n=1 Tax=Notoacmeibacter sp. MSK16QG-6 TaxID=2957982 RepID=UPI0020A12A85|nr:chromate efflux transporter [Notoacmeibacter sp. MSK16QG-6]MCP1199772.1 chromate efflux transporter [Notoacmeibacter sp. MSK16QG-6]
MSDSVPPAATTGIHSSPPDIAELAKVWGRIGILSFGGPAAQIALIHREVVDRRGWLSEAQFLNALSFCMFLPGPEAMQLATYGGWRTHGVAGGLIAGSLFVLPGAVIVFALAAFYAWFGDVPLVEAAFIGIKAAVVIIVIEALLRVARRALLKPVHWFIAAAAFVALFLFAMPYPLVIVVAGLAGFLLRQGDGPNDDKAEPGKRLPISSTIRTAVTWLAIWLLPLMVLDLAMPEAVLGEIGRFFSLLATVTFGGAYAVLAYMAQEAVETYRWLTASEMIDALGLAETTPGPLILVTEFVGFLAAARADGTANIGLGTAGTVVTLWATFAPCFLWIFVGAPFIDEIQKMPRLQGALSGITAAVVGVILNLSVWFGLNAAFGTVERAALGPVQPWVPDLDTLDWRVPLLAAVAAWLILRRHWEIVPVLAANVALVLLIYAAGWSG